MRRHQSQEAIRIGYENLEARMKRLLGQSNDHNTQPKHHVLPSKIVINNNYQIPRYSQSYRSSLKTQNNGLFGIDISNNVGKVSRNTGGIKKCNQRHLQSTVQMSYRNNCGNQDRFVRKELWNYQGKQNKIDQKLFNYPSRYRGIGEQERIVSKYETGGETKIQNKIIESHVINKQQIEGRKQLQPGKIYSSAQLKKLFYN